MDPVEFLNCLGEFPGGLAGDSSDAVPSLWGQELRRALGTIAPECLIPLHREQRVPCLTEEHHDEAEGEAARETPEDINI